MEEEEAVIENILGLEEEEVEKTVIENIREVEYVDGKENEPEKKYEQTAYKRGVKRPLEEDQGGRKLPLQPAHPEDFPNVTLASDDGLQSSFFSGLSGFFFGTAQGNKTNLTYEDNTSKQDLSPQKEVKVYQNKHPIEMKDEALKLKQVANISETVNIIETPNTKTKFKPTVTSTQLKKNILISCNECNETFTKPNLWALHMKKHTYPLQCQFCQRQFKTEDQSRRHQQLMHSSLK